MKVLRIKPMCRPEVIDIDGSLESLQKEVGGLIQATYGMYYETTHDGDKGETYVDVYKKWDNKCVPD